MGLSLKVGKLDPGGPLQVGQADSSSWNLLVNQNQPRPAPVVRGPAFQAPEHINNFWDLLGTVGAGAGNGIASTLGVIPDSLNLLSSTVYNNEEEKQRAQAQLSADWQGSIPGSTANLVGNTGNILLNSGKASIGALTGNRQMEQAGNLAINQSLLDTPLYRSGLNLTAAGTAAGLGNELMNKGINPNEVTRQMDTITNRVGFNTQDPQAAQDTLINSGVQLAAAPLSAYGTSKLLDGAAALGNGFRRAPQVADNAMAGVDQAAAAAAQDFNRTRIPVKQGVTVNGSASVAEQVPVTVNERYPGANLPFETTNRAVNTSKQGNMNKAITEVADPTQKTETVVLNTLANTKSAKKINRTLDSLGITRNDNSLIKPLQRAETPEQVSAVIRDGVRRGSAEYRLHEKVAPKESMKPTVSFKLGQQIPDEGQQLIDQQFTKSGKPRVRQKSSNADNPTQLYDGPIKTKEQIAAEKKQQIVNDAVSGSKEVRNPYSTEGTGRPLTSDGKLLKIKLGNVKDPVRKAELQAEHDARVGKPPVEGEVIAGPPPKQPGVLSRITQPTRDWIAKHGAGGQMIAQKLGRSRDIAEVGAATFIEKIPTVMKLGKKDFATFVDTLDALSRGDKIPRPPDHIIKAVQEWSDNIGTIREHATKTGLEVGDQGKYYFPREYKDLAKGKNLGQYAQDLVRTGQAKNMEEAMKAVNFMRDDYRRSYGHLEKNRLGDLGGYEKTHDAMLNYITRSYDRIGKANEFGPKNEKLDQLRAQMTNEGYDVGPESAFDRTLKTAYGANDKTTTGHRVSLGVRQFNANTKLETAGLSNLNQTVNTATVAGIGRTAKGIAKFIFSPEARRQARETGVALDHVLQNTAQGAVGAAKSLASPLFKEVEKSNRAIAAITGQDWANALAKKAARGDAKAERQLRELGVTGDVTTGKLSRMQQVQAGRKLVERTQFKVDPQDLPGWADTPGGKLVSQFQTFGYKQSAFVWHEVLKEAGKGNFLPLARYVAVATPSGMVTTGAKAAVKLSKYQGGNPLDQAGQNFANGFGLGDPNNKDSQSPLDAAIKGFMGAGGAGIVSSIPTNIVNAAQYDATVGDTSALPGAIASAVGGPTAGVIAETGTNISKGIQGNWKPLGKEAIGDIPAIGGTAANVVLPSKQYTPGTTDPSTLSPDDLKKFEGASFSEFKKGLVQSDKDIFALQQNKDASNLALKNGKVNQDQLDAMQAKYNRYRQSVGLPISYINGITYADFSKFDKPTQDLVTEASLIGKKKFTDKTEVDKTAQAAIDTAKQNAWPNTGDIKASNKLALEYVKSLQDMKAAGDDQAQQYGIFKDFWKKAVKEQYGAPVTDAYGSSIADLKRLSAGVTINGKSYTLRRNDLDQAVALDNRLLEAGLIDSPKFSNKTRTEAGYGAAPASKLDGVGYDGGKASSGRGGRGSRGSGIHQYGYAVNTTRSVSIKQPASSGAHSVQLKSVKPGATGKPKVSMKKSKV